MKCKNCDCQVSSDFKHSFTTNCCPKCGQTMMQEDVKDIYLQMSDILNKEGNDLGDVAIWLVNTHHSKITQFDESEEHVLEPIIEIEGTVESIEEPLPVLKPAVKKPAPKVKRTQSGTQEHSLLSQDRTNLFSKRAGVDKIKYETIVKDIQGGLISHASEDMNDIGDGEESFAPFNEEPLSNREMQSMAGLFEGPGTSNGQIDYLEIEKLQKLEQLAMTGSIGKIKRSS
jgi:hypothetical protein